MALIGGIYAYKIYKDEEQETLNAEIALENASIPNQKWKTARTVAFASTAVIIAYLYFKKQQALILLFFSIKNFSKRRIKRSVHYI